MISRLGVHDKMPGCADSIMADGQSQTVFSDESHPSFSAAEVSESRYAGDAESQPLLQDRRTASQSTLDNGDSPLSMLHDCLKPPVVGDKTSRDRA